MRAGTTREATRVTLSWRLRRRKVLERKKERGEAGATRGCPWVPASGKRRLCAHARTLERSECSGVSGAFPHSPFPLNPLPHHFVSLPPPPSPSLLRPSALFRAPVSPFRPSRPRTRAYRLFSAELTRCVAVETSCDSSQLLGNTSASDSRLDTSVRPSRRSVASSFGSTPSYSDSRLTTFVPPSSTLPRVFVRSHPFVPPFSALFRSLFPLLVPLARPLSSGRPLGLIRDLCAIIPNFSYRESLSVSTSRHPYRAEYFLTRLRVGII